MSSRSIRSALVSVFAKDGLEPIIRQLHQLGITLYSTGGTQTFIEGLGIPVIPVEDLTDYPSILDGRVKTLHPKIFGGILARRESAHLDQLKEYAIPEIDLVIVDLYPFEETVQKTTDHSSIIEKIDIGGISLIRAAAKNYADVVIIPCREEYGTLQRLLDVKRGVTDLEDRKYFATKAFRISAGYDTAIAQYFSQIIDEESFSAQAGPEKPLRYGENPHQRGTFYGPLEQVVQQLHGKELSYNNLVDVDAGLTLISEFRHAEPTFVVIKHTNACGVATRSDLLSAWHDALAGDPVSAFGGILAANREIDARTAKAIDEIFYEVLLAPGFSAEALEILQAKKNRILLVFPEYYQPKEQFRSLLNGILVQDYDDRQEKQEDLQTVTKTEPTAVEIQDLLFANTCVKHLKSNTIVLVRNQQLLGMGCGQTSRVDALQQAIIKAKAFGFDLEGAVMASDAFFPFPDCVEIADQSGIRAVIQPGGSIKDKDSISYCDAHQMAMVFTGNRHFKH
ncbi:MAG: bifunctional phosphoribosylaminoimidazolecarboxamide formyltransferase/IMP cyclohydrolase [Saprospiraceae bacterium]|nr:bifunctional phosphoribosylaminoimidazolecarboxamide formyltransferase/IMP cyclohydrolase [Saprospiraceae bacterium]